MDCWYHLCCVPLVTSVIKITIDAAKHCLGTSCTADYHVAQFWAVSRRCIAGDKKINATNSPVMRRVVHGMKNPVFTVQFVLIGRNASLVRPSV